MAHCIALLTGSLDSMLSIRLMQLQQIQVTACTLRTAFTCNQPVAELAAAQLQVPLHVLNAAADYLELLRQPRVGFGRGANPCVDCRIYMLNRAEQLRRELSADFLVTGEVVGQRPKGQKRLDLDVILYHAAAHDRVLRPLSARRLPPTWPERAGIVDRDQLGDFSGQNRGAILRLARRLGVQAPDAPAPNCRLTEPSFGARVFDLLAVANPTLDDTDWSLLTRGRHFRIAPETKFVVGRNSDDNQSLTRHFQSRAATSVQTLLEPLGFAGPSLLILGPAPSDLLQLATAFIWHFSKWAEQTPRPDQQVSIVGQAEAIPIHPTALDHYAALGGNPATT